MRSGEVEKQSVFFISRQHDVSVLTDLKAALKLIQTTLSTFKGKTICFVNPAELVSSAARPSADVYEPVKFCSAL